MILFDDKFRDQLLPFTFTRPCANIRCGTLTIAEKWALVMNETPKFSTQAYLQKRFGSCPTGQQIWINGRVLPTPSLVKAIKELENGQALTHDNNLVAANTSYADVNSILGRSTLKQFDGELFQIERPWDIFQKNEAAIQLDWEIMNVSPSFVGYEENNQLLGTQIFIHPTATVQGAFLNASNGPIYIGEGAEVMEGSLIRGPFSLGNHATVKMGAKIYGATTIGPHCKVGGEVTNSVIFGYSNKGHDGFLGDSVLGEWCNLGADTNNSNLKNNYGEVRSWDYVSETMIDTGLQFCGLLMGDHSKSGINTMFNTGTVVGVAANVFGGGFPQKFIPSFSWGGASGFETFHLEKAFEVANKMMERRKISFDEMDEEVFTHIFSETHKYRK
ncbi:MAG: UDP-N-acetylglucosamine diphosphorylase/glucosamine-1-phosphate N-acetyltransferase [Flavobacteriales bacterium]|jgi:UDP-N-acetylglucosamine diphosphorylase/glucosamine-1-phosphate N-acetyltransferase